MAIDVQRLGARLKEARELQGLSQSALATQAGMAKSHVSKLESGEFENPGLRTISTLAAALKTDVPTLLEYNAGKASSGTSRKGERVEAEDQAEYDRLLASAPAEFKAFLAEEHTAGRRLPTDMVRLLLTISIRGKRPEAVEDWRFLHGAVTRSIRRA